MQTLKTLHKEPHNSKAKNIWKNTFKIEVVSPYVKVDWFNEKYANIDGDCNECFPNNHFVHQEKKTQCMSHVLKRNYHKFFS